jgi:Ca-activated chloride channel family protein
VNLFLANPIFTGLLTVASLLAVGVLYWIKPPPPTVLISSSLLWTRLLRERKKSSLMDRLRWLLSLIIACAIAVLLVTASGAPELFSQEESEIGNMIIVIDNSGTMAALRKDGSTRWDHAVRVARSFFLEAHPSAECLILDTSGQLVSRLRTNKWRALEDLENLTVSFENSEYFPEFADEGARVVFISDGVSPITTPPGIETISVFESAENVGITNLTISQSLDELSSSFRGLIQITNGSLNSKEVAVRVSGLEGTTVRESITLEARSSGLSDIDLSGFDGGPLRVSVTSVRDAFPLDDLAYIMMPSNSKFRITLVTSGNLYLETGLKAMPSVDLSIVRTESYDPAIQPDLYIFDRFTPEVRSPVPTLTFLTSGTLMPEFSSQAIAGLNFLGSHPILRGVTLSDLRVGEVSDPSFLSENSQILWGDVRTPLLVAKDFGIREVQVGFSLDGSNFPLQPAFPIFLKNTIEWMLESDVATSSKPGRIGIPLDNATVVDLEGTSIETSSFDGQTIFQASAPNLYSASQEADRLWIPVNLTNPDYTLINETKLNSESVSGNSINASDELPEQVKPRFWRLLVVIALFLVFLEWVTYHRRVTV